MKRLVIVWLLVAGATTGLHSQDDPQGSQNVASKEKPRANWAVFPAAKMPAGTNVTEEEASKIPPPAAGTKVVRDETRGFLIMQVRSGAVGDVTIYARDITQP